MGGRGKAGGIKVAQTPDEAEVIADQILGMDDQGLQGAAGAGGSRPRTSSEEIYLGMIVDRERRRVVMMASSEGGVDIEEVAATNPDAIKTVVIDPFLGHETLPGHRHRLRHRHSPRNNSAISPKIAFGLYQAFMASDAELAEINPLVVTGAGSLLALDGKMVLDDNGLFRHPDLEEMRDLDEEAPAETEARINGLSYVKLDGEIGCMVNGAGLAMATMDIVKHFGGSPANFLDIGGGAKSDKVAAALRIILSDPNVKAVLFNIFGGITRCDEVARGILEALDEVKPDVPMIARLVGTNEAEGRAILAEAEHDHRYHPGRCRAEGRGCRAQVALGKRVVSASRIHD